jgi:hypothetical protein
MHTRLPPGRDMGILSKLNNEEITPRCSTSGNRLGRRKASGESPSKINPTFSKNQVLQYIEWEGEVDIALDIRHNDLQYAGRGLLKTKKN